ncbi:MAG: hypothetical protein Q9203_003203, partial [Teloschistes exilis]
MSAGFGFSVGDIVAGLKLIKQSIEAIQDTKGSSADFEALGHEIASLKAGLEAVEDLKLDQTFGSESKQCVAIGQAIARCWKCVDVFLSTIAKYQPWLRSKAASASLNWKANLKKIQWALCKKDDVNRFRAQLERHTSSISMLLVTLQVSQSFHQLARQESRNEIALETHDGKLDLQFDRTNALLVGLSLDQRQMFRSLLDSNRQLIQANERMAYELQQVRGAVQLQIALPPQVALQKPVTLLDACGTVSAFHLDFINCAEAFLAVLKIRFQQHGVEERGLKMLDNSQFVLEDFRGRLDLGKPWSQIIKPNQKIDMSMIFHRGVPWSSCPACQTENEVDFEAAIECSQCGLFYRRVKERILRSSEEEAEVIRPPDGSRSHGPDSKRLDRYTSSGIIDQFRRVQLVYTYLPDNIETAAEKQLSSGEEVKITDFWTREERRAFHSLINRTGTDWQLMSDRIRSKTPTQVESYYNHRRLAKAAGVESRAKMADRARQREQAQAAPASGFHLFDMSAALLDGVEKNKPSPSKYVHMANHDRDDRPKASDGPFQILAKQVAGLKVQDQHDTSQDAVEDELKVVDIIESLCMQCHEDGETRLLLTKIPYFREVILMSFSCDHCGFSNTEVKSAGEIQERGAKYSLDVRDLDDMQRQIIKSDTSVFRLEDLDIEMPPGHSQLTNVEGILLEILKDLESGQRKREKDEPELWAKINAIVQRLLKMTLEQKFPFTITLDDPSGNSWIEPSPEDRNHKYHKTEYPRTAAQNAALGLSDEPSTTSGMGNTSHEQSATSSNGIIAHVVPQLPSEAEGSTDLEDVDILAGHNYSIPTQCPGCTKEAHVNLQLVNIPYFKEVVVSAVMCLHCNYRSSDVKTGGEIPRLGKKIYLHVKQPIDLSRDILKSETCCVKIEEVGVEVQPGTMGGRFTTVEGLLAQIRDDLRSNVFDIDDDAGAGGDSMPDETRQAWNRFFEILDKAIRGEMEFTILLEDPLANSYVQSLMAPEPDPQLREEDYARTTEEEDDLGISDMRTRMGEDGEYEPEKFEQGGDGDGEVEVEEKGADDGGEVERAKAAELVKEAAEVE